MKVYRFGEKIQNKINLCLGYFDSVHKGHREIVDMAKIGKGKATIFTFDSEIQTEDKKKGVVFTLEERMEIFQSIGVENVILASFEKIKDMNAREFVDILQSTCDIEKIICGEDYRFGKMAKGNTETLREDFGNALEIAKEVEFLGEKASSNQAKKLISNGDIKNLNELLGGEYFVQGYCERGFQNGTKLGFPTANIKPQKEKVLLREGVYIGRTKIKGKMYPSMINVGIIPTFDVQEYKIETHAVGIGEPLYGEHITVYFQRFLRDSKKFESVEELKSQLQQDIKELS